jgi:hypothetical protein
MPKIIPYRREGFEKQYRYRCPSKKRERETRDNDSFNVLLLGCNLLIAYEMNEHRKSGPYTYIVEGALTDIQGSAPPNALINSVSGQAETTA